MKGVKFKCGLLLVLFTIFGLSVVVSSDTNALKYSYDAFPIIQKTLFVGSSGLNYPSDYTLSALFDSNSTSDISSRPGDFKRRFWDNGSCHSSSTSSLFSIGTISSRNQISWSSGSGLAGHYLYYDARPSLASDYSSPNNLWSQVEECVNSSDYTYDSIYGGTIDVSTGDYDKFVSFGDIFYDSSHSNSSFSGGLKSLQVPLDISQTNVGTVPSQTPLSWTFEIFSSMPFTNVSSNPSIQLDLSYFTVDPSNYHGTLVDFANSRRFDSISCSYDSNHEFLKTNEDLTFSHFYGFKVTCDYSSSFPMSYIFATLRIKGDSSVDPVNIFNWTSNLYFGSSYIVTNNDPTYSGLTANDRPKGSDITKAPGYSKLYCGGNVNCDSSNPNDGFFGLGSLFNFNFINPFEPVLHLFTDNSSCVNIPTLASMIHSEETQVCPWFDSNVRNIVTPVLGLSSMMLIFGFAVHWLGARSGNLFEDSVETDNYSFHNKFRSNKK